MRAMTIRWAKRLLVLLIVAAFTLLAVRVWDIRNVDHRFMFGTLMFRTN